MLKRLTTLAVIMLMAMPLSKVFAQANVTFQLHMGVYMQLNLFNPATDSVVMRGDFEHYVGQSDWSGYYFLLAKSATNDSIYTLTIPFPDSVKGKVIQYKFVLVHKASDTWESIDNRKDSITSNTNQQVPLTYFNNQTTTGTKVNITFQADMSSLLNQGFNPSTDSIEVRGDTPPLNWGPGVLMQQDLLNPTIFTVTLQFSGTAGTPIQWKFHCDPQTKFANTGWDNIANNRIVYFPKADTTVGPIAPAIQVGGVTTATDTVTFHVDMTGAHEKWHNSLITGLKSVWIAGSVTPLQWPSNWLFTDTVSTGTLIKLYDDGLASHGDVKAGDNIYSAILVFPSGSTTPVFFKYGAVFSGVDTLNGGASYLDNEAGFGLNHTLNLSLSGGSQTADNKFGDQVTGIIEEKTSQLPTEYTLSQNYPNPFNPTTSIRYTIPKSSLVTLKVYNILGQEVATVFSGFQNAGTFTASFDASRLSSGVYLYRLQAGKFSETRKMILMK